MTTLHRIPDEMIQLGERLKFARTARQMSARELAQRAGVSNTLIMMLEEGMTVDPKTSTLVRICAALGCDVAWMAVGDESRRPRFVQEAALMREAAEAREVAEALEPEQPGGQDEGSAVRALDRLTKKE